MAVEQKRGSRRGRAKARAGPGSGPPPGGADVDSLLPRVASGDAAAFAKVYDLVAGPVYGLVSRVAGDPAGAEQLTAEVLVEVWRSASRFSPAEGSGLAWIMTMATRRALSYAGTTGDDRTDRPGPAGTGGVAERAAGTPPAQRRGLASLPGPQLEAVLLASCGYTWRQVADLVGAPTSAVAERLRDGLLELGGHPR
jgi:RNA polymerase sigma-70 factor (ECF subfamily)